MCITTAKRYKLFFRSCNRHGASGNDQVPLRHTLKGMGSRGPGLRRLAENFPFAFRSVCLKMRPWVCTPLTNSREPRSILAAFNGSICTVLNQGRMVTRLRVRIGNRNFCVLRMSASDVSQPSNCSYVTKKATFSSLSPSVFSIFIMVCWTLHTNQQMTAIEWETPMRKHIYKRKPKIGVHLPGAAGSKSRARGATGPPVIILHMRMSGRSARNLKKEVRE